MVLVICRVFPAKNSAARLYMSIGQFMSFPYILCLHHFKKLASNSRRKQNGKWLSCSFVPLHLRKIITVRWRQRTHLSPNHCPLKIHHTNTISLNDKSSDNASSDTWSELNCTYAIEGGLQFDSTAWDPRWRQKFMSDLVSKKRRHAGSFNWAKQSKGKSRLGGESLCGKIKALTDLWVVCDKLVGSRSSGTTNTRTTKGIKTGQDYWSLYTEKVTHQIKLFSNIFVSKLEEVQQKRATCDVGVVW